MFGWLRKKKKKTSTITKTKPIRGAGLDAEEIIEAVETVADVVADVAFVAASTYVPPVSETKTNYDSYSSCDSGCDSFDSDCDCGD